MRSIADAIEALRAAKCFRDGLFAQVRTHSIEFPGGKVASIVFVIGPPSEGEPSHGVALPAANFFTAKIATGDLQTFEISGLDRAWAGNDGIVELSDGTRVRGVNVVPTVITRELTALQKRIVYWTIKFIKAEDTCYRYGPASPDLAWLDYGKLHDFNVPSLDSIGQFLVEQDPTLRVSHQTIANALAACGMRRPRSGKSACAAPVR